MDFIAEHVPMADLKAAIAKTGARIFLYGAGDGASSYAKIALPAIEYHGLTPACFIDDDKARWGKTYRGYEIKSVANVMSMAGEKVVFISSNYFESMAKNLDRYRANIKVFTCTQILESAPKDVFAGIMDYEEVQRRMHMHATKFRRIVNLSQCARDLHLNIVDIQVTERCTMKCKDCSNLMQYYAKPRNAEVVELDRSIVNLLDAIDELSEARILGGEPFLFKELPSAMKLLQASQKVKKILIYTNATFVPKEAILQSLINEKTLVEITDYDDQSHACLDMIRAFEERGIRYISHRPQNWTDSARIVDMPRDEQTLTELFSRCCVNDVLTLLHGKLYHCPFSANAHNLKAIATSGQDFVDVIALQGESLRDAIKEFYFGRNHLTACGYCLGRDYTQMQVEPAIQTKKVFPLPVFAM